jgi:hypothetical protein
MHTAETHHDLSIRTGNAGFYFRNTNRGVTLTADRINWTFEGQEDGAPYKNIRNVHLQTGGDWRNPIGICRITFADGHVLIVSNADSLGYPDEERRSVYRDFVHTLHTHLAELPDAAISFTTGWEGFRYPLIIACAIGLGIICLVVPIIVMIKSGNIFEPIGILLGGVALCWPLMTAAEKNSPRSYDPRYPPEELLA